MSEIAIDFLLETAVEIIPPDAGKDEKDTRICLCCQRASPWIDDDGCGICNECIEA
ncbi:hypothetical protein RRU01S_07_01770 [Agrobacterium rubi TR3 = NBRC 13261]|uniref:Uncharacterized protein n=1 Tax=Agrobacterium rubi TR3 = NBRC 13261 TaxID=1368415 RepID=A0A081CSK6_9HYPH|nr:hypothetical protein [Agrobacterium rubi]MBP1878833.1 hypothetical protein [Agrobacterium rubi]GAK69652.1 hypothetical protein RRU01S_07_01770 [Agrobacterium rubi TR3 = NBRC 13261]